MNIAAKWFSTKMTAKLYLIPAAVFLLLPSFAFSADKVLGMADCVNIGLEMNFGIHRAKTDVKSADTSLAQINAQYEPVLNVDVSRTGIKNTGASTIYGEEIKKDTLILGASKKLAFSGGNVSLSWQNEIDDSASTFKTMAGATNPGYNTDVAIVYSQPLLKNFAGKNDRAAIETVNLGKKISSLSLEISINALVANIEKAYLELVFQKKNLVLQKKFLQHDRELLEVNKRKYKDGLLEEVDLIATESAVTLNEIALIRTEDSFSNSRDALLNIMGVSYEQDYIFALNASIDVRSVKEDEVVEKAFANRPDLKALELKVIMDKTAKEIKKNETLPGLNFQTSYGLRGSAGNWSDDYNSFEPNWSVGLNLKYFPFNELAGSLLKNSELILLNDKSLQDELKMRILKECREITRRINTQIKYLNSAARILKLEKKKLKLEEIKFQQGRSSLQWTLRFRDDLIRAEIDYQRAETDYRKAVADLKLITGERI
ncbi:TolC family protein [bacterium]|nr:TolC family protein [bacterium]MBU3956646.1 TolC family protein [bacterium]MBU4134549.1 TolC family protein [bacterium]